MSTKRENGEGSIYPIRNKAGKITGYRAAISFHVGKDLHRKARRCKRRSDASIALQEMRNDRNRLVAAAIAKISRGKLGEKESPASTEAEETPAIDTQAAVVLASDPTVENYLTWWLQKIVRPNLADNTYLSNVTAVNHIIRRIGTFRMQTLTAVHVHDLVAAMEADGEQPPTRRFAFVILKRALKQAVKPLHLLKENPCDDIPVPSAPPKKIHPFTPDEVKLILEELRETRHFAPVMLAFMCGLRQGEIAGLQPGDINWSTRKINVCRQVTRKRLRKVEGGNLFGHVLKAPKSSAGSREVPLPDIALAALRDHMAIRMREGHAGSEQLFPAYNGGLMDPTRLNREAWKTALKKVGLRFRGFHHARHTYATTALMNRTPLAVVSKTMGHASQMITLKSYSHWMPAEEFAAAEVMDKLFG